MLSKKENEDPEWREPAKTSITTYGPGHTLEAGVAAPAADSYVHDKSIVLDDIIGGDSVAEDNTSEDDLNEDAHRRVSILGFSLSELDFSISGDLQSDIDVAVDIDINVEEAQPHTYKSRKNQKRQKTVVMGTGQVVSVGQ